MRIALRIAVVACLAALVAGSAAAQTQVYSAILNGAQEVPPTGSSRVGGGSFALDTSTKMLTYTVATSDQFIGTASHIHGPAAAGANADPIFTLTAFGPAYFGIIGPLTDPQIADLDAGLWYVNIHSGEFPNGEIRGQIVSIVSVQPGTWGQVKALYAH